MDESQKTPTDSIITNKDFNFFKHNVCHLCKQASVHFKRCSNCKTMSYCSREHQARDWQNHKTLCKIIANEDKDLKFNVTNQEELRKYKEHRGLLWHMKLGRKPVKFETQAFMFPRICAVCYKREGLFDCVDCLSEFYCSTDHQQQHSEVHKKFCKSLRLSLDMECYFYFNDPGVSVFGIKKVKEDLNSMPESLDFLSYVVKSYVPSKHLDYINSCDQNLGGLTILFGLEQGGVLVNRKLPKSSLEIHIVGATTYEYLLNWGLIAEIYFHWIKNLEELHVVFVGPGVTNYTASFQLFKTKFCHRCQNKRNVIIKDAELYKCFYHEKLNRLEKPDIVVALNAGLTEYVETDRDTWKDSLKALVQYAGVPLVLTAYTEDEIQIDLKRITDAEKVKVVYGPKENPYANLRPLQDWEAVNVFYVNQFLTIVKKM